MTGIRRLRSVVHALVLLALALPALAQPEGGMIGPYVQNVGTDNATICWSTLAGEMTYAPPTIDNQTSSRLYNSHKLVLRYLTPDTTYTYDVLNDGTDRGKGTFTTFPTGEKPFRFVTIADCHNWTGEPIVKLAAADKPDMVFLPGDLVFEGLQVFHWEDFFRINQDLMRDVPYYPALGNHELSADLYFDFFALPGNQRYYSFNRGVVHFVVLDTFGPRMPEVYWHDDEMATNQPVTKHQLAAFEKVKEKYWREQLAWLRDDLASNQQAKYIFAFFHHPMYTSYPKGLEEAAAMRKRFGTVFEDYHVSAVFNGHHHEYNHALVGGVHYIVTGAGGAGGGRGFIATSQRLQPGSVMNSRLHSYARVDVGIERTHVTGIDINGDRIEEFDILPRAVVAPASKPAGAPRE